MIPLRVRPGSRAAASVDFRSDSSRQITVFILLVLPFADALVWRRTLTPNIYFLLEGEEGRLPGAMIREMNVTIEMDREEDGRWIAEAVELPGVMCYGQTPEEAISSAERLAIEVIADRIAHGEMPVSSLGVSFSIPDELLASH